MDPLKSKQIAIIGLGLLGASLGLALKKSGVHRLGWARRSETRTWCIEHDVIDETTVNVTDVIKKADITILCLPIPAISSFIEEHASEFKNGSIVTDIGSDKGVIVAAGEAALEPYGVYFVGSHPMAGTEKNGCEAAFAELYDNAEILVTYTDKSDPAALDAVEKFWHLLHIARVKRITPEVHDDLVAHTSHISHLLALALTLSVLDCHDSEEEALRYNGCATGFRDTSRIASSNPAMWREIVENNRMAVLNAMSGFDKWYAHFRELIQNGNFDEFEKVFAEGKHLRDSWTAYKENHKK